MSTDPRYYPPRQSGAFGAVLTTLAVVAILGAAGYILYGGQIPALPSAAPSIPTAVVRAAQIQAGAYRAAEPQALPAPLQAAPAQSRPAQAPQSAAPAASEAAPALPLNSQGQPVITAKQQEQMDLSLRIAADEQSAETRQGQLDDAVGRPPDITAAQAAEIAGRDPCHVPRADPATCSQGIWKPTPVTQ